MTGPTVVGPLVRNLRLRPRLQTILEAEGVFIDPIGAFIAVLALEFVLAAGSFDPAAGLGGLGTRLAVGVILGAGGGLVITGLLRLRTFVHGLENVLVLSLVVLLFYVSDHLLSHSGLLAVTVAGVIVGNLGSGVDDNLRECKDQLTLLFIGTVFILLAADVDQADVWALGWGGFGVLVTLMVVGRPLTAWISTIGSSLTGSERLFLAAVAPRGIVAAAVASLVAATLESSGIPGGSQLRALVFLVIAGTVVAAVLGLRLPARNRVAMLGAQGLGLALGTELQAAGVPVVVIDSDPQRCRAAENSDLPVVFGDGLQERTLRRARLELAGTAVGATFNDHLNSQFVREARQAFGVPTGLVSVGTLDARRPPEHVTRGGADELFDGAHDQERWDVRWRQREVRIVHCEFRPADESASGACEATRKDDCVMLTLERGGRTAPMRLELAIKPGDRAAVAINAKAEEEALNALSAAGWQVLSEEQVEAVGQVGSNDAATSE